MNAPPEAKSEYSRGSGPFGRLAAGSFGRLAAGSFGRLAARRRQPTSTPAARPAETTPTARLALALGALLGALLVLVSQFTALYRLHSATSSVPIKTVVTGANHAWAPIPLALVAAVLAYAVYRHGSRAALAGLAALGIATLLIVLLGDLPNARSSGLIGSSASGYVQATSSPSAGLYMETLGAIVLLVAGGIGLLLVLPGASRPSAPRRRTLSSRPMPVVEPPKTQLDLQTKKPDR